MYVDTMINAGRLDDYISYNERYTEAYVADEILHSIFRVNMHDMGLL